MTINWRGLPQGKWIVVKSCYSASARQELDLALCQRAPQRDLINLWSSHNEVALKNSHLAVEALRKALKASDPEAFRDQLGLYSQLRDWDIPRPPYRRLLEWQHLQ
jgi:hypothetical protein